MLLYNSGSSCITHFASWFWVSSSREMYFSFNRTCMFRDIQKLLVIEPSDQWEEALTLEIDTRPVHLHIRKYRFTIMKVRFFLIFFCIILPQSSVKDKLMIYQWHVRVKSWLLSTRQLFQVRLCSNQLITSSWVKPNWKKQLLKPMLRKEKVLWTWGQLWALQVPNQVWSVFVCISLDYNGKIE